MSDLVKNARALIAKGVPMVVTEADFVTVREMLSGLCDEVEQRRLENESVQDCDKCDLCEDHHA